MQRAVHRAGRMVSSSGNIAFPLCGRGMLANIISHFITIYVIQYRNIAYPLPPDFQVTVDLGKDAEFQCSVTGQPHPVISWAKDGLPVREGSSGRSKITGNDGSTLRISSIVRDDKGMYQCFAKNDYEMVQATAELRLGGKFCVPCARFTLLPLYYIL